jgi:histone-arginine methyltransferase CARM1
MHKYSNVSVILLDDQQIKLSKGTNNVLLTKKEDEQNKYSLMIQDGTSTIFTINLDESLEIIRSGSIGIIISLPKQKNLSYLFKFSNQEDANSFKKLLSSVKSGRNIDENVSCQFDERTEESSAVQYFQFYGYLSQQQNMMQDYIRTSTYQRAILDNSIDFAGKVVLDVGAGSGILSFFAAQAGARKVYAVEASSMAQHAKTLVENNHLSNRIHVIAGKIEEINIPELVDIIISEPMGYMLYNERMLETYLHAKKWLKPNGKMYPTTGDLYVSPFTDEALYMEQVGKANFWYQQSFYGVDLTTLRDLALDEYFKQPIVDNFDVRICLARPIKYSVNFLTANEEDLHEINIPLSFQMTTTAVVHGLAFWFDVLFDGTSSQVWLSTAPTQPLTHWYQVRCLFMKPLTVNQGKIITGHAILHSNRKQSYDVEIYLQIDGTTISVENTLDLKNPYFRYPNQPLQVPPGQYHESPTEQYWNGLPTEQATMHANTNQFSQNCSINTNNLNTTGTTLNNMNTNFQSGNTHRFTLPCISSSNHSDRSTNPMANGFISFANTTSGNPFTQQSHSTTSKLN